MVGQVRGEYFDWFGQPITLEGYVALVSRSNHQVAKTDDGEVAVSTVWLGVDHQYGDGPPLIFETMVIGGEHAGYMQRYPSLKEARAGHELVAAMVFGVPET